MLSRLLMLTFALCMVLSTIVSAPAFNGNYNPPPTQTITAAPLANNSGTYLEQANDPCDLQRLQNRLSGLKGQKIALMQRIRTLEREAAGTELSGTAIDASTTAKVKDLKYRLGAIEKRIKALLDQAAICKRAADRAWKNIDPSRFGMGLAWE